MYVARGKLRVQMCGGFVTFAYEKRARCGCTGAAGTPSVCLERSAHFTRGLLALVLLQQTLAEPDRRGSDLYQLIVSNEFESCLEGEQARRLQHDRLIGTSRSNVREFFPFRDVHLEITRARVFANNHAFVNVDAGTDEEFAALLQVPEGKRDGFTICHTHENTALARLQVTGPASVAHEPVMQNAFTARVREKLTAVAEQT